jgi:hypothetical protein
MTTFGSPACNTSDVPPVFAPTGWKTVALDRVTFNMADYRKEAAFYIALMGWTLRGDDGKWVPDDIHTAPFKSYHTETPNGFNLQISYVTHDNRLALPNAVNPKKISG